MSIRALATIGPVLVSVLGAQSGPVASPQGDIAFVENRGQWDGRALFRADSGAMTTWLTARGWTFTIHEDDRPQPSPGDGLRRRRPQSVLRGVAVRMAFENAVAAASPRGEQPRPGVRNYFLGDDPDRWTTGVPAHARVVYEDLYPGVDLVVRGQDGHVEYDLCLAPGATLASIVVRCEGQDGMRVAADGSMVLETALGPVRQTAPVAWQVSPSGQRVPVACRFVVLDRERFAFAAPQRRADLPLVVDPGIVWSRLLGGSSFDKISETGHSVRVAANGDVLACGTTMSVNFPATPGAFQGTYGGCTGPNCQDYGDGFVMRLSPDGSALIWCTYLGAAGAENVLGVAEAGPDDVLVVGWTDSPGFPTTSGVFQPALSGAEDAFLLRLDWDPVQAQQTLVWSTFLGGSQDDFGYDVAWHPNGALAVVGWAASANFPVTTGATLAGASDAFVSLLAPNGSALLRSTLLGGSGQDGARSLAVHANGDLFVGGETDSSNFPTVNAYQPASGGAWDAFLLRLDATLSNLSWSTYLGGAGAEWCFPVVFGPTGDVYVTGWTDSPAFPTTPGAYQGSYGGGTSFGDGYVARLDPSQVGAAQLVWSTYVGSTGEDIFESLSVERSGIVTVVGGTNSGLYPTTTGAYDLSYNGGSWDAVVTRLDPSKQGAAQLIYSSYIGGGATEWGAAVASDASGGVVFGGQTWSWNFPFTQGSYGGSADVFLTSFDMLPTGVTRYGTSTPACTWPIHAGVNSMPASGNAAFALTATGAADRVAGAVLLGLPNAAGSPFLNLDLHLQLGTFLVGVNARSNILGYSELPLPIPATVSVPIGLGVQWVFLTKAPCSGTGFLSSSDALRF